MKPLDSLDEISDDEYFTTVLQSTKTKFNAEVIALKTSIHHLTEQLSSSAFTSSAPNSPNTRQKGLCLGHDRTRLQAFSATLDQYEALISTYEQPSGPWAGHAYKPSGGTNKTKSQRPSTRDGPIQPGLRMCMCCCDSFPYSGYRILDCGDVCCLSCLGKMILPSIKEEAKLPPRCCGVAITGAVIAAALDESRLRQFLEAVYIAMTPVVCRVWCPKPSCSEFTALQPQDLHSGSPLRCWACKTNICTSCKQYNHPQNERCVLGLEPPAVLNMIYKYGWRQCIRCHCLLELKEGCRQVRCSCGAFFCYICMEPGQCSKGCSISRLNRYRHQAEMARKRDADNLAQKDAQLVFWTVQNPRFARLEHQSREELTQFFDYYTKQLESLNARHESYLSQSLKAKWNSARTLLDSVVERQNKTLSSVDDLHVRQEAQLIQQQSSKELKLNVHIERLQKHWNSIIPNSSLHRSHLQEQMESLKRLQRRHSLEIKFLREAQQRIQDDIHERFIKERKVAAETQQRRERRASNMISREESIFQTAFQRRLESLWKLWALRWEELCLQLRLESHGQYARFRPTWLQEVDKEEVRFAITELRSVLITHYGKEAVDQLVRSLAGEEKESDSVSLWEWEDEDEDDGEDIDYHDFVRPWKKARKATRQSI